MRAVLSGLVVGLGCLWTAPAPAQLLDVLKGGGGGGGAAGALLGGGLPSVSQAGTGNVAGVLKYCIQHKYLGGGSASGVSDGLLGKLPGRGANDPGYQSGSRGLLDTGGGQNFNLGGGGLKDQLSNQLCDQVLQRAKSLL
jgi:hypothetical protein